jgi:RNA polymerase sigma factor for flagellar operon FliA
VEQPQDPPDVLQRFHSELALVDIVARQLGGTVGRLVDIEDLKSLGRQGLLEASRRYDPARGVSFRTFANFRVRGAMLDGIRAMSHLPRRLTERLRALESARAVSDGASEDALQPPAPGASAEDAERALDAHLASMATAMALGLVARPAKGDDEGSAGISDSASPEEAAQRAELLRAVRQAVQELPEHEAELIERHYLQGERLDTVARDLKMSKSWASRLHTRAVGRLTKRLRGFA